MERAPVTYVVVTGAPPARRIHELLGLLPGELFVAVTPTAAAWIDEERVLAHTSLPIRAKPRSPDEPKRHPAPELVIAAPVTFNTVNKWAAGINDNVALGVLNEALGEGVPIIAAPVAKPSTTTHPAWARSVAALSAAGVRFTATNAILGADGDLDWRPILEALPDLS